MHIKKDLSIYQKAFKAYDVRAIFGEIIDEAFAYILGRGIALMVQDHAVVSDTRLLLGSDTRFENTAVIEYFVMGLQAGGVSDVSLANFSSEKSCPQDKKLPYGCSSSGVLYYLGRGDFSIGCVCTASHNPQGYVGMKFFDATGTFFATDQLYTYFAQAYNDISDIPSKADVMIKENPLLEQKKESLFAFLSSKFALLPQQFSFSVDFSHGAGVSVEREFFAKIVQTQGHDVTFLHDYPDGRFPVHESDTGKAKNYLQLGENVIANRKDFGIMFDGDVDRIGFVSEKGEMVSGDIILAIIAKQVLQENANDLDSSFAQTVVYDVMCTRMIKEKVESLGGKAQLHRMGRMYINHAMKEANAVLGGEISGHYMFASLGGCEMPLLALYYVMQEACLFDSFDAMIQHYKRYPQSPIMNFSVQDKDGVLEKFAKHFAHENPLCLDGVNVYGEDYMVTMRKSNTEPIVRLIVEANTPDRYTHILDEVMALIEPEILAT